MVLCYSLVVSVLVFCVALLLVFGFMCIFAIS